MDKEALVDLLAEDGLVDKRDVVVTPLSGGVSCDVLKVHSQGRSFVVKQALEKLRVKDDWLADVERNRYEHLYLTTVGSFLPGVVPKVLHVNDAKGFFCMEWMGDGWENWKTLLLEGKFQKEHAHEAGRILGIIHRQTFRNPELKHVFDTTDNFIKLRLDAYLLTTGRRHPDLESYFEDEVNRIKNARSCLVHGDFSPKNLLVKDGQMIVLDCETAWFGDPVFDLAFLLNHLILKMLYHAPRETGLKMLIATAVHAYFKERNLDVAQEQEAQKITSRLLAMLMLARVDGKSPVEYLVDNEVKQDFIRTFVTHYLLSEEWVDLGAFADLWEVTLRRTRRFDQDENHG